jgi:hypothetical protein
MQIKFTAATEVNGHAVTAGQRDYEVHVDGELWGWVSGPMASQPLRGKCWVALKKGAYAWGPWSGNREAAILAAL